MKAAVSGIVPRSMRSTGFGIAWFLGSRTPGALYDCSPWAPAAVSSAAQLLAVAFYAVCVREARREA